MEPRVVPGNKEPNLASRVLPLAHFNEAGLGRPELDFAVQRYAHSRSRAPTRFSRRALRRDGSRIATEPCGQPMTRSVSQTARPIATSRRSLRRRATRLVLRLSSIVPPLTSFRRPAEVKPTARVLSRPTRPLRTTPGTKHGMIFLAVGVAGTRSPPSGVGGVMVTVGICRA
jgi:hypothetical protein